MIRFTDISPQNNVTTEIIKAIFSKITLDLQEKEVINHEFDKIDVRVEKKVLDAPTVSEYFNFLWVQSNLNPSQKQFVFDNVHDVEQVVKKQICKDEQEFNSTPQKVEEILDQQPLDQMNSSIYHDKASDYMRQPFSTSYEAIKRCDHEIMRSINQGSNFHNPQSQPTFHYAYAFSDDRDEIDAEKQRQANDLIAKMRSKKKKLELKLKSSERANELKQSFELQLALQRKEDEKKHLREEKIRELEEKFKNRMEEKKFLKQQKTIEKAINTDKLLHEKFKEQYEEKILAPFRLEQELMLEERHQKYQPFEKHAFRSYERDYNEKKAAFERFYQVEADKHPKEKWTYRKPDVTTKFHQQFLQELDSAKKVRVEQLEKQAKKRKLQAQYGQYVKEQFLPKVQSSRGQYRSLEGELLEKIIGHHRNQSTEEERKELEYQHEKEKKQKGKDYLKQLRQLTKTRQNSISLNQPTMLLSEKQGSETNSQTTIKAKTSTTLDNVTKKEYMTNLRNQGIISRHKRLSSMDTIISKKQHKQYKYEDLEVERKKLDLRINRQEKIDRYGGIKIPSIKLQKEDENDDNLVDVIKAKLELLDGEVSRRVKTNSTQQTHATQQAQ